MSNIEDFAKRDHFAALAGIETLEVSPGRARAKMEIDDRHLNGHGVVHGGAIFTLADLAFAAASNSHGRMALAINAGITYVKATRGGTLFAEAEELSLNPKLGTYLVTVTDDSGERVATFQGMVYRKKDSV